jgi:diguanylate cyclase (GGDEF)-like protein
MVDMDHFKTVNDKYGHDSGDMVLKSLAEIFKLTTRGSDTIIRWGGEEFLIILKNCEPDYIDKYCKKLLKAVNSYDFKVLYGEKTIKKTCSIGYVKFPLNQEKPDYLNIEQAIIIADLALYYAKEQGRNQGVRFDIADFYPDNDKISVREHCNLHGVWKAEN